MRMNRLWFAIFLLQLQKLVGYLSRVGRHLQHDVPLEQTSRTCACPERSGPGLTTKESERSSRCSAALHFNGATYASCGVFDGGQWW